MNTLFQDQEAFMKAGDATRNSTDRKDEVLAVTLIEEEFEEFMDEPAFIPNNNINSLKECIDVIYVCCQYMNTVVGSKKAQKLWDVVHAHNMSKCQNGKLVKREDGKVMKPHGFDKKAWIKEFNEILGMQ